MDWERDYGTKSRSATPATKFKYSPAQLRPLLKAKGRSHEALGFAP